MRRATLGILALLAGIQGALILVWDRPGSDELAERERRVVPDLERDRIREIAIHRREDPVELELEDGSWRIRRPLRALADAAAVEAILSAVEFLETERAVPGGISLKQLGLDPPAIRLRLHGARTVELHLGALDPSRHGLYLSVAGKVVVVGAALLEVVDRDLDSLRDRELSPLRASEIAKLQIRVRPGAPRIPGDELTLGRAGAGRGFLVSAGGVQTRARSARALQITAALASLRATRFPRAASPGGAPELSITASGSGARAKRIAIELFRGCPGRAQDRLLRVGADPAPTLACVEAADLAPLLAAVAPGGLEELRDLRLTDLDEPALRKIQIQSRAASLAIVRDGARWQIEGAGSERGDADDGEIRAWIAALRGTTTRLEAADPARVASLGLGAARILLERDREGGSDSIELGVAGSGGELPIQATGLKGAVLLVAPDARQLFEADPLRFRSRRVLTLPRHSVSAILRESGAVREELRRAPEGGFRSSTSARSVDQDRVLALLDRLAKLEAVRYAAPGDRLAPSIVWRLRLEAETAADAGPGPREIRIELGPELRGGGCLARTPGVPLFLLGAADCSLLRQSLSSP